MKKALLLTTLSLLTLISFGQDQERPEWLTQLFGESVLAEMSNEKVSYYVAADELGFSISEGNGKDLSMYPNALEIAPKRDGVASLTEASFGDDFHYQLYQFSQKNDENTYYRIGDSDLLLTIYSVKLTQKRINDAQ